jgi:hypothetical protein
VTDSAKTTCHRISRLCASKRITEKIIADLTDGQGAQKKNSGSMRRASRVYLSSANVGKVAQLRFSLLLYVNVVNYFIERFWTMKDFTSALADKVIVSICASSSQFSATFSLFFPLNPTLFDKLAESCGLFA